MSTVKDEFQNIKDEAKDKLSGDINELKNSFAKLRTDVMTLLSDAAGVSKHAGKSGTVAVKDQATHAVDGLRSQLEDLQHRGNESLENVSQKIRENPVASAAIAIGAGFILAKLFSHRR